MTADGVNATVVLRLMPEVDTMLRDRMRRKGDLANLLCSALKEVDLSAVPVAPLSFSEGVAKSTTVKLPCEEYDGVKKWAADRGCSVNAFLNGVLRSHLENSPKPRSRTSKAHKVAEPKR